MESITDVSGIIELEQKLHDPKARKNYDELAKILSDDFLEIGTSGRVYDKKLVISNLLSEEEIKIDSFDFKLIQLSNNIIQLLYKTRIQSIDGTFLASLRSSIWKFEDDRWQLLFHQGTKSEY